MPRISPITGKSDVPAEHHAVVDAVVGVFGNVRGPFSMLLHSPKLAERMLGLVTFFRDESVVEPKLRSIAILTAVREREAAYVWSAQVGAARRNGLREEVIDLIRAKGDPGSLPEGERDIIVYTRQLMRTNRVDTGVFDWQVQDVPGMDYTMVNVGGGTGGGIMKNPMPGAPSSWLSYVLVDDVAAWTAKAKSLGATVLKDKTEVPTFGWFSIIQDPTGAVLGLWQSRAK